MTACALPAQPIDATQALNLFCRRLERRASWRGRSLSLASHFVQMLLWSGT